MNPKRLMAPNIPAVVTKVEIIELAVYARATLERVIPLSAE
jgi:hypothetical protein